VIIGIDDYLSLPKISGAVSDAKAVEEFLKSYMNVPPDRMDLTSSQPRSLFISLEPITQVDLARTLLACG
jgi:hypothetical protein